MKNANSAGASPFAPEFWIEQWNSLNASVTAFGGYCRAATWNAMAAGYGRQSNASDKDDRVLETVSILESRGVCFDGARVLDIGCGPGKCAEAFARKGAHVVAVDIAEKMVERLNREIDPALKDRITPLVADFAAVDLDECGFAQAFDLVFANMTPAISGPTAFLKMMNASRRWCWFRGWAGPRENPVLEKLHQAIFSAPASPFRGNFLCAYNLVCASGYFPDCFYSPIQWTHKKPLAECVEFHKAFFSKMADLASEDLSQIIKTCLGEMAVDGYIENTTKGHAASMLWTLTDRIGE
jgi:SAM-dependent methyltransferase